MKVKLILPSAHTKNGTLSDFTHMLEMLTPRAPNGKHNIMAFMPLSLPTLAALVPDDVTVRIIDENIENIDFDDPADVVGITFVSFMARRAYQIADAFRARGVYVVLGGVHVTVAPDEALAHADTIVIGEAEITWPQFLADFRSGKPRRKYACEQRPDLQTPVVPRWDLVSSKYYLNLLVQTTRGCSFDCDFCTIRSLYGPPRNKPVEHVIREIQEVAEHRHIPGPLKLMFADDNIIANVSYAKRLFTAMIPMRIRWTSQASINIAQNDELLDLAHRSGCDALLIGFESISQASLDSINKGKINRVDSFRSAVEKIQAKGISVYSYIIFGFDDNTPTIFQDTLDFVQELGIEFPLFNVLSPIPGTRLTDRLAAEDRLLAAEWEKLDGYHVCMQPKNMTPEDLRLGLLSSIIKAYSYDAIFDRLEKSYARGGSRSPTRDYLARFLLTALLGRELLRCDGETRRFVVRTIREMWRKRDVKLHTLLMFLDRFRFARQIARRHPEALAFRGQKCPAAPTLGVGRQEPSCAT